MASTIKKAVLAASISLASLNAQATLTSYNANGLDLVYSSVSNVSWTKDGNLLGSMMASDSDLVNKIIAASPTITNIPNILSPSGTYNLQTEDFNVSWSGETHVPGQTTWFGAMAFINYLNSISYGGSNQWRLPTITDLGTVGCEYSFNGTDCGFNVFTNGNVLGNELAELYHQELGSKSLYNTNGKSQLSYGIVDSNNQFANIADLYWSGSQYTEPGIESSAWGFDTNRGEQDSYAMIFPFYAWAITSGQIAAVPEPENLSMLLAGLGLLGIAIRRNKKA